MADIKKRIMDDMGCGERVAESIASNLWKIDPLLKNILDSWTRDEFIEFEYKGITLSQIMEKESTTYLDAILTMDTLIKNPDMAEDYPKMVFARR